MARTEEENRARIGERARRLTNDDLHATLGSRATATAAPKPTTNGAATGNATAKAITAYTNAASAAGAPTGGG